MLPTSLSPHLSSLALAVGLALAGGAWAAEAPDAAERSASTSLRPNLGKTLSKRKDDAKAKPEGKADGRSEVKGVSMSELADLIDQKIAEVSARRATAPVVQLKSRAPRVPRAPKGTSEALGGGAAGLGHAGGGAAARLSSGRDVPWAYGGATGPESWAHLKPEYQQCQLGKRQSPIDIRDGIQVQLDPIQFDYRPTRFRVIDNGHTVQVNLDLGNSITVLGRRYELVQFHFHRPSEERINGRAFPMSAHLVHKSPSGDYAVVAVLMDQGMAHPLVQQVWNNLPLEKHQEQLAMAPMDLSLLLPEQRQYYTYMGSLTTPPCTEGVLWLVMKQAATLSPEQIAIFNRLYPHNARPVQPAAGRMIKEGM